MEYAVDFISPSDRPFFEESADSRPPPPYAIFIAFKDAFGRAPEAWAPTDFGFVEQTGAPSRRLATGNKNQTTAANTLHFYEGEFPEIVPDQDAAPSPWATEVRELRANLGLPITALVEALNVTRPAFYSWLRGEQPNRSNQQRIRLLAEVANVWRKLNIGPLSRYWNLPAPPGSSDLRSLLMREDLSLDLLQETLKKMGIGQRLLSPRKSKPLLIEREKKTGRSYAPRKAWGTTSTDSE